MDYQLVDSPQPTEFEKNQSKRALDWVVSLTLCQFVFFSIMFLFSKAFLFCLFNIIFALFGIFGVHYMDTKLLTAVKYFYFFYYL